MKIVIPGGSGQVGTLLARAFHGQGHEVIVLSRKPADARWRTVAWDGRTPGPWSQELDGADAVINLAGRSVNCRYHARNRQTILEVGAFILRTETELILKSRRVVPGRLLQTGFAFRFPRWAEAARDLWGAWRASQKRVALIFHRGMGYNPLHPEGKP